MTLATLIKFLYGDRDAILCITRAPTALWLGLLFVVSAGFAREYDGEDLLHAPWYLAIPLGASLLTSVLLYLLVRVVAGPAQPTFVAGYREFLALYWLTAPLAWLYAVPVERWLSDGDAMSANLWFLALVAAWRVPLITRVVSVLYGTEFRAAFFMVLLFADTVLLVIVLATPLPIVSFMGGIRLSESEQLLRSTLLGLRVLGILTWPVWFIGSCVVAARRKGPWERDELAGPPKRVGWSLWSLAALALLVWIPLLPRPQAEQRLRRQVEQALYSDRIRDGVELMSAHNRSDFPPHWRPPPRLAYRETKPSLLEVREAMESMQSPRWVHQAFDAEFANYLRGEDDYSGIFRDMSEDELNRHLASIEKLSLEQRTQTVSEQADSLRNIVEYEQSYSADLRARIARLLTEAKIDTKFNVEEKP